LVSFFTLSPLKTKETAMKRIIVTTVLLLVAISNVLALQSPNITGTWDFTVETAAGSGTPTFTFKQEGEKLTGSYKGQLGEAQLTGTVKGSDVKFSFKLSAQGQDLTITYTGKIEGADNMKGTAAYGELGEGTWTAKRKK